MTRSAVEELIAGLDSLDSKFAQRKHLRAIDQGADVGAGLLAEARKARRSDSARSLALAGWALQLAVRAGDRELAAQALRTQGQAHIVAGRPHAALRKLDRAISHAGRELRSAMAIERATCLTDLGAFSQARDVIGEARFTLELPKDARRAATLDMLEARVLEKQERYESAQAHLESARDLIDATEHAALWVAIQGNLANVLTQLGHYDDADAAYALVQAHFEQHDQSLSVLQNQYNRAYLLALRGRFHDCLRALQVVEAQFEAAGDLRHVALVAMDRAEVELRLGLPTEAREHAARAATLLVELGHRQDAARARFFEGVAGIHGIAQPEAIERLEAVSEELDELGCAAWAAVSRHRLAEVYRAAGQRRRASSLAGRAATSLYHLGLLERGGRAELCVVGVEMDQGEFSVARDRLLGIRVRTRQVFAPWLDCELHHNLALCEERGGDLVAARESALRAVKLLESHRISVPPDEYMTAFLDERAAVYSDATRLLFKTATSEADRVVLFETVEASKGRALQDLLDRGPSEIRHTNEEDRAQQDLESEIDGLQARMIAVEDAEASADVARRAEVLRARQERLRQLVAADDRPRDNWRPAMASIDGIREALGANTTLIQYFLDRRDAYVCVVQPDKLDVCRLPSNWDDILRLVRRLRFQLDRPKAMREAYGPDQEARLNVIVNELLVTAYELLVAPIRSLLTTDQLAIIPHGPLHAVPFAGLQVDGRALIDDFEIVTAPSASVLLHCIGRPTGTGRGCAVLGVADESAPLISEEAANVAHTHPDATIHLNAEADRNQFARAVREARFVHVATHGSFEADDPMASGLLLGDGWLPAEMMRSLEINADVVVLSGCSTGRAWISHADEVLGVPRAMLCAGARTAITSLWDVTDASAASYMDSFHRGLASGQSAAAAARQAALEVREAFKHPSHWAPFVVMGAGLQT